MPYANHKRANRREPERTQTPRKAAPIPSGHQVATFDRPAFRRGEENQQLRVVVDAVEGGRTFASIRVWRQDRSSGEWWPTHAGVTVRLNEGEGVLNALADALDLAKDPAVVAEVHAHNRRIRQGQPGATPPAATAASGPGPNLASSRATAREPMVGSVAPWNGPDRFAEPDATPASNPGFDEDPPF